MIAAVSSNRDPARRAKAISKTLHIPLIYVMLEVSRETSRPYYYPPSKVTHSDIFFYGHDELLQTRNGHTKAGTVMTTGSTLVTLLSAKLIPSLSSSAMSRSS